MRDANQVLVPFLGWHRICRQAVHQSSSWMTTLASSTTGTARLSVCPVSPIAPLSLGIGTFRFPTPALSTSASASSSSSLPASSLGRGTANPSAPPANFRFPPAAPPTTTLGPVLSFLSPFPPAFRFCRFALFLAVFASATESRASCRAWNASCSSSYFISFCHISAEKSQTHSPPLILHQLYPFILPPPARLVHVKFARARTRSRPLYILHHLVWVAKLFLPHRLGEGDFFIWVGKEFLHLGHERQSCICDAMR